MNASKTNNIENGGLLSGPVTSSLEAVSRNIPSNGIDFGYCSVSLETQRKIVLENIVPRSVTGATVRFTIETDSQNFTVSHSNGVIQPGKKHELTITFNTEEAKVQVALLVIKLVEINSTQELTRTLKVSAIGKYPFITIN